MGEQLFIHSFSHLFIHSSSHSFIHSLSFIFPSPALPPARFGGHRPRPCPAELRVGLSCWLPPTCNRNHWVQCTEHFTSFIQQLDVFPFNR